MVSIDLFEMEFDNEVKIKIDTPFFFQETEKELKEYLLDLQDEGDLTDKKLY